MIRVYHVTLPTGLDVVARRVAPGELYIVVSDQLPAGEQRAAVRTAIRAARRQAWDFGYLPLPVAAGLMAHTAAGHVSAAVRAHSVLATITGAATAAAGAIAAAVLVTSTPAVHQQPGAIGGPPPPAYSQSATPGGSHPASGSSQPGRTAPGASGQRPGSTQRVVTVDSPGTSPQPAPQPSPRASTSQPGPAPTTSSPVTSTSPAPQPTTTSPSSSPPPSSGGTKNCLIVLGLTICL
jgi:hypothetical protein